MCIPNLNTSANRLSVVCAALDSLNPLRVLSRGYSMAVRDGIIINSISDVSAGDRFTLRLADGEKECEVL